jgi:hypothetical protein
MKLWVGTSGYSYKEWLGNFYPERLAAKEMLRYYAAKLPAVEINNTFYRLPKETVLKSWAEQVPSGFRFVLKAPQKITHVKRLKDAGDETAYLFRVAKALGRTAGATLFQLPPHLKKDLSRLETFLALLPAEQPAAFEFRRRGSTKKSMRCCASTTARFARRKWMRAATLNYAPRQAGVICVFAGRTTAGTICSSGKSGFSPSHGSTPTFSSSTRTKASGQSSRRSLSKSPGRLERRKHYGARRPAVKVKSSFRI